MCFNRVANQEENKGLSASANIAEVGTDQPMEMTIQDLRVTNEDLVQ